MDGEVLEEGTDREEECDGETFKYYRIEVTNPGRVLVVR